MELVRQLVQKKSRVVIPKRYREALGIREGDEIELRLERGGILIRPVWLVENPTERLSGLVRSEEALPPEEIEREIYAKRAER